MALRYSIRFLLIAIGCFCILLADASMSIQRHNREMMRIQYLRSVCGVEYEIRPCGTSLLPFIRYYAFARIVRLDLGGGVPVGDFYHAVADLRAIEDLSLHSGDVNDKMAFTDDHLPAVETIAALNHLSCDGLEITDRGLGDFHKNGNSSLKSISIMYCDSVTDDGFVGFNRFQGLESIAIVDLPITDASLEYFNNIPTLKSIEFVSCENISLEGMQKLSEAYEGHLEILSDEIDGGILLTP